MYPTSGQLPLLSNWFSGCRGGCGGSIFSAERPPRLPRHPLWVVGGHYQIMTERGLSKTIAILHRSRDSWRFE
jgi:hypothetical protein